MGNEFANIWINPMDPSWVGATSLDFGPAKMGHHFVGGGCVCVMKGRWLF